MIISARNESASHIGNTNDGVQNVAEAKTDSKASGWGEVIKSAQNELAFHIGITNDGVQNVAEAKTDSKALGWELKKL